MPPRPDLDRWKNIKLGWVARLIQLGELGTLKGSKEAYAVDETTFSRELNALEDELGLELTETVQHQLQLTAKGKRIANAFSPVIQLMERIAEFAEPSLRPYYFRMGAGGSVVNWFLSSRLSLIKEKAFRVEDSKQVRIDIRPYSNREMVRMVVAGALDCAIVRGGVVEDRRLPIRKEPIGEISYYLYVPRALMPEGYRSQVQGFELPQEVELDILRNCPIATVGPDGECRTKLDAALRDACIDANIEFSYRQFPMLWQHMLRGTHVTIMPSLAQFEAMFQDQFDYLQFPLRLLRRYSRTLYLIAHKEHADKDRMPWLDFDALKEAVQFKY